MKTSKFVREMTEALGYQGAVRLIRAYGGRRLYVPAQVDTEHPLALSLGYTKAEALCAAYGPGRLDVPDECAALLDLRNRRIAAEAAKGAPIRRLGDRYGLSPRMIRKIVDAAGIPRQQGEMVPPRFGGQ